MSPARQPAAASRVRCARRPPPESRDDSGVLLGMAILAMVILTIASTGVVLIVAADWRTTLNRDSAAEAAAAAVSAEYLIDGLITAVGPEAAQDALYRLVDPTDPAAGREATWLPVAGETTLRACRAEGCWTVTFSCAVADARLLGLQAASASAADCDNLVHGSEIPVWTATITAAAHCDPYPVDATLTAARDACQAVAPLVELVYEPVSLPLYSTVLGDGLIAADRDLDDPLDPIDSFDPVYDVVASQLGADWVAVTSVVDAAGNLANDPIAISSTQTGLFINTASGNVCETRFTNRPVAAAQNIATAAGGEGCDAAAGAGTGALELHNITGQPLSVDVLKREACEASPPGVVPAVVPGVVEWAVASLPPTPPPPGNRMGVQVVYGNIGASDTNDSNHNDLDSILTAPNAPRTIIATGSVYIHQDIDLPPAGGVVLIISGCHVFVVPPLDGTATRYLTNVAIIAGGGLWSSDLNPPVNYVSAYRSGALDLPRLEIKGSVVTGWAGQVTLTGHDAGAEIGIAGFVPCLFDTFGLATCEDRTVPAGWAAAETQFWPGREYGSWRQR